MRENKLPKKSKFDFQDFREPPSNPCTRALNIKREEEEGKQNPQSQKERFSMVTRELPLGHNS